MPPRPAVLEVQTHTISILLGHAPKACTVLTIFTPQACAPKACQARDPHTHDLCSAAPCPSKPVKPGIHRHAGSPLCWPVSFRHAKLTLQRPTTSSQLKASTHRPVGPHPLATCHRKAPNLPKRYTQTSLDAKELASAQLRLQFYCPKTGDFFFFFLILIFIVFPSLRDLLHVLLFHHSPPLPFFFSFPLYSFYLSLSLSFLSFFLGLVSINTVTQLTLNYT
jgi:hypothetical protein